MRNQTPAPSVINSTSQVRTRGPFLSEIGDGPDRCLHSGSLSEGNIEGGTTLVFTLNVAPFTS